MAKPTKKPVKKSVGGKIKAGTKKASASMAAKFGKKAMK